MTVGSIMISCFIPDIGELWAFFAIRLDGGLSILLFFFNGPTFFIIKFLYCLPIFKLRFLLYSFLPSICFRFILLFLISQGRKLVY